MTNVTKVFVSSTSYDLLDVRAEVCCFIRSLGYQASYFEHSDFLTVEEMDRHDMCVARVEEADALLTIIDRRYGAQYCGTRYYPGENISVTWAETRRAIERRIPVAYFVRRSTWLERHMLSSARKKGGSQNRPIYTDQPDVFRFLDYLQSQQRIIKFEFDSSVDLKKTLGGWLDATAKRISYSLVQRFNSAFVLVETIESLLSKLYSIHRGQIWLFNNDLELIKSAALFDDVYVNALLPRLQEGHVEFVRIILSPERYDEFLNPEKGDYSKLLKNLQKLGDQIGKVQIARVDVFQPPIDISLCSQNLVFYTVDGDLRHPETVGLVRQHARPFMANINGVLSREDLVVVSRELEVPSFYERSHITLASLFGAEYHFNQLGIHVDAGSGRQVFTLEPFVGKRKIFP